MTVPRTVYGGEIIRVTELPVDDRARPYEFVERRPAVIVLPILLPASGEPEVLAIENTRAYYGTSYGLPGGNVDGVFEDLEDVSSAALRELREEVGYGYPDEIPAGAFHLFSLKSLGNVIKYRRYFAVARGVKYIGGEENSPRERIKIVPVPIEEYLSRLFKLEAQEQNAELNAAFAKAAMTSGEKQVVSWLTGKHTTDPGVGSVPKSFEPWMQLVEK